MATQKKKTAVYETQDARPLRNFFFPTVGGGVTVRAATQEEANEKAAEMKKNFDAHGSPSAPEEANASNEESDAE